MPVGHNLKALRRRLDLTLRKVEQATITIANAKSDRRFVVSDGWLTRLEKSQSGPNIYKLFSLSVVYNVPLTTILKLYGIDIAETDKFKALVNQAETQLLTSEMLDDPLATAMVQDSNSGLLSGSLSIRLEFPLGERKDRDPKSILYGYIGLKDFTMYPLIRPGAIVRIDHRQTRVTSKRVANEYERAIYFIELRGGYACGWCDLNNNELTILAHPLSPAPARHFSYPQEAEIIGRVVGFDTICVDL
jgi:transcriptional regulator with XRE-family HTH domain